LLESRVVRVLILLLLSTAVVAQAETIYLKNGKTIYADKVQEDGDRLRYDVGENSYAVPKALVDRIENSAPPQTSGAAPAPPPPEIAGSALVPPPAAAPAPVPNPERAKDLPAVKISADLPGAAKVLNKVIHDGRVDEDALAFFERTGDRDLAAVAFYVAGRQEAEKGDRERAAYYMERAIGYAPDNTVILNHYAAVLVQLGRGQDAIYYAEHSTRLNPESAEGFTVLGFAYYAADRDRDAVDAWKRSLELHPDDAVQHYLAKVEREVHAEADFAETNSNHFSIHYDGNSVSSVLRQQIEETLERNYDELVSELGIVPRARISVSLYTQQAFFDVTQAPSWIGAINDGKLRVPIQGVTGVTPQLQRVLKHETAHSFINQVAHGRCPQWLNEGLAQLVEPKTVASRGTRLAQLYSTQHQVPLSTLENSFLSYSSTEAGLAYDEALAAVEFIRDNYGMDRLRMLLEKLGEGMSTEAALQDVLHLSYSDLEQQLGQYLERKYGS